MAPSYVVETHKSYEPHNHIDTYDTTQCGVAIFNVSI